jgi:hypothetical protein
MNEAAQQLRAIANEMDNMINGCDSHYDRPVPCYGNSFVVKPLQDWSLRLTALAQALSTAGVPVCA